MTRREESSGIPAPEAVTFPGAFTNGFTNYGAPYGNAGYYKDQIGIVHLMGALATTGVSGNVAFTLPVGYRPASQRAFPGNWAGSDATYDGWVQVTVGGGVAIGWIGAVALICLDGITFRPGV